MIEYKYTISEDNSVKIEWIKGEWNQKNHPKTAHAWTREEAESWALQYIQACKNNDDIIVMPSQMPE